MAKEFKLSQERLDELKEELHYLKTVREKRLPIKSKRRALSGPVRKQRIRRGEKRAGKLYSRIVELENIIAHVVIIDSDDQDSDSVVIGSRITVEDCETGDREEFQIVGSQEADPMNGRISEESPFGRALLGKKSGEEVLVDAPAGMLHYRVVGIQK